MLLAPAKKSSLGFIACSLVRQVLWPVATLAIVFFICAANSGGMPEDAVAQMKKTMARVATGHKTCLTKEQAMKPKEDFFSGANSNCRYDKFSMDDGKMTGTMRCTNAQGGGAQLIDFDGSYSPESYDMRMASTVEGASAAGPMKMVMRVSSKRTGECDGSEMKVATN